MNLRDLFLRVRALVAPRRVERELDEELAFHIEYDTQRHIANGLSAADARARALARFGPVPLVADRCRDARGTALIDDLARDVLYAFRTFRRAPLAAFTIVATVALGLGLVAAVFTFFNAFLRADAVQNPGELFDVVRQTGPGADSSAPFTRAEYEALRGETRVFSDVAARARSTETRIDGHPVSGALVTGNFFRVLGVQAVLGRTLTPADDELSTGQPIVLRYRPFRAGSARAPDRVAATPKDGVGVTKLAAPIAPDAPLAANHRADLTGRGAIIAPVLKLWSATAPTTAGVGRRFARRF